MVATGTVAHKVRTAHYVGLYRKGSTLPAVSVGSGCSPISARRVDTPSLPLDLQAELLSGARLLGASPTEAAAPGPSPPPLGRERTALLSPSFTHILSHAPEYSHTPDRACQPLIFFDRHRNLIVQEVTLIHPLAELLLSTHSGPVQPSAAGGSLLPTARCLQPSAVGVQKSLLPGQAITCDS